MNLAHNPTIKKELFVRWEKLGLKFSDILKDAEERMPELKISFPQFSRWKNNIISPEGKKQWLSDNQVLWLATRWGIFININFGVPSLTEDNHLQWTIPPYDEFLCLKKLHEIFVKKPATVKIVKKKKKK